MCEVEYGIPKLLYNRNHRPHFSALSYLLATCLEYIGYTYVKSGMIGSSVGGRALDTVEGMVSISFPAWIFVSITNTNG